jgi:hypothetical protein
VDGIVEELIFPQEIYIFDFGGGGELEWRLSA